MKKTLILLAALAFATAGTSFAQSATAPASAPTKVKMKEKKDRKTPAQKADHGAAKIAKELGLSADQETRIEQILLARQQEMQALKAKHGDDKKAAHADKKALKERYDAKFKDVLTAEQYAKYQQLKDEHKGQGRKGAGEGKTKVKAKA